VKLPLVHWEVCWEVGFGLVNAGASLGRASGLWASIQLDMSNMWSKLR